MRRTTSTLTTMTVGAVLFASTISAQQFLPTDKDRQNQSSASESTQRPDSPGAMPGKPGAEANIDSIVGMAATRGARYLLRNGLDYINYQEYDRALRFLREAEARQVQLSRSEKLALKQAIERAQRGLREAVGSQTPYALSSRSHRSGGFVTARPETHVAVRAPQSDASISAALPKALVSREGDDVAQPIRLAGAEEVARPEPVSAPEPKPVPAGQPAPLPEIPNLAQPGYEPAQAPSPIQTAVAKSENAVPAVAHAPVEPVFGSSASPYIKLQSDAAAQAQADLQSPLPVLDPAPPSRAKVEKPELPPESQTATSDQRPPAPVFLQETPPVAEETPRTDAVVVAVLPRVDDAPLLNQPAAPVQEQGTPAKLEALPQELPAPASTETPAPKPTVTPTARRVDDVPLPPLGQEGTPSATVIQGTEAAHGSSTAMAAPEPVKVPAEAEANELPPLPRLDGAEPKQDLAGAPSESPEQSEAEAAPVGAGDQDALPPLPQTEKTPVAAVNELQQLAPAGRTSKEPSVPDASIPAPQPFTPAAVAEPTPAPVQAGPPPASPLAPEDVTLANQANKNEPAGTEANGNEPLPQLPGATTTTDSQDGVAEEATLLPGTQGGQPNHAVPTTEPKPPVRQAPARPALEVGEFSIPQRQNPKSTLTPELRREVEEIARRQDREEASYAQRLTQQPPNTAGNVGSMDKAQTQVDISRAPSPAEARPIRAIPVPEDWVPLARREWSPSRKYWAAPALCHMPLYFQDTMLERYGHSAETYFGPAGRFMTYPVDDPKQSTQRNQIIQPAFSVGLFAWQVLTWPYALVMDPPWEAQYDLGYWRPGDQIPTDLYYQPLHGTGPPLHGRNY